MGNIVTVYRNKIYVNYLGWKSEHNVWISLNDKKIKPMLKMNINGFRTGLKLPNTVKIYEKKNFIISSKNGNKQYNNIKYLKCGYNYLSFFDTFSNEYILAKFEKKIEVFDKNLYKIYKTITKDITTDFIYTQVLPKYY